MHGQGKSGFSLVEIMIVSSIIGLLAALGIPAMNHAGIRTRNRIFAAEITAAGQAFVQYALDFGTYPPDTTPSRMPSGMSGYLRNADWTEDTVIGGKWDWDNGQFGVSAAVSVYSPDRTTEQMAKIDGIIDDGNLATGQFRARTSGYMYILEE
ncbi:type II secretion system protein [Pontiella sp.]|uniref:type II secretion system protein n=1 Tax=Pontiella sp. TaxID=2837462 RepID=UPI003565A046